MAVSEAAKEAIYLKNLLYEITGVDRCITMYNDNMSAQKLAVNPLYHKRSKHIDIRHHFIREAIGGESINLLYLETDEMMADILTKGLVAAKHHKFLVSMGLGQAS